jgi:hypothetical protein
VQLYAFDILALDGDDLKAPRPRDQAGRPKDSIKVKDRR